MNKKIFFSIITPTFNRGNSGLLKDCVMSIQNQMDGSFDYEHIIVDDGSTDKTKSIILEMQKTDDKIKYFYKKNGGVASAYELGIKKSLGEYIIMLDSDDMLSKDSLHIRAKYLKKHPSANFIYGKAVHIDENGIVLDSNSHYQSLYIEKNQYIRMLISNFIHQGTTMIKSDLLKKISIPKWLKWSQDYFFWCELLRPEKSIVAEYIDEEVCIYREHKGSYTQNFVKNDTMLKKQLQNDDRIRSLHKISNDLDCALKYARFFEKKYLVASSDSEIKSRQISQLKQEISAQSVLIQQMMESRSWKLLEKVKKFMVKK